MDVLTLIWEIVPSSQDTDVIILGEVLCPSQLLLCCYGSTKGIKLICKPPLNMDNYGLNTTLSLSGRSSRANFGVEYNNVFSG